MTLLSKEELKTLAQQPQTPCVSIYLPTHTAGPDIRQDPIRFKNLMKEAEEELVNQGMRHAEALELLASAHQLDRPEFWRHQNTGLALFVAPDFLRYYRLPLDFEEFVVVGDRFELKPLMPLLTGDGRFYILALSKNQVRLLEGTRDRIREFDLDSLEDIPQSLADILKYEDPEEQFQFQEGTSGSRSIQSAAMYHGANVGTTDYSNEVEQLFQQIDNGLREFFQDEHAPLVLAGVNNLLPVYREANHYPHLIEESVTGNPELMKPEELHEEAWTVVQPYFQQAQKEAAERYAEFSGNSPELASNDIEEIVSAAYYQRIDTLFVPVDRTQWGKFDSENNTVEVHDTQELGDEDLLDLAAVHTLLNGGTVFAVEPDEVPASSPAIAPVAAIFRFPA